MPIDFQLIQRVFQAVAELPPAERAAALDRECGGDTEVRRQVDALLRAHDDSGELPAADPEPTGAYAPVVGTIEPGQVFAGRYKLREKLGEGGMGVVFVADQTEPVQRRVALKIIRSGQDSRRLLARFEQERQALALMDHPNIAKVLDAGLAGPNPPTPFPDREGGENSSPFPLRGGGRGERFGTPYFVMELVKGLPLTRYCDEARLSPRQRLELFIPVCHAVQHAHQKGIIHRDLKPSNILVGLYDGRPVPKVIDFGVAKATGPRLTEESIYTEVGSIIGTLEYMSPEQAELNNLDIDTRSDIYALGVILYELLTGAVPFSRKELEKAGLAEMLRVIKEAEPPKPSTKLSLSGTLANVAAQRQMEPKKLTALVRGELDWIVMKALEKDRGRRYETATGFALDVQRYLSGEPVLAVPPSAAYRLRKFVRRHRGPVVAAGLVLLTLVCGIAGTTWSMWRAEQQRQVAVEERDAKDKALVAEKKAREHAMAALRDLTDDIVQSQMTRNTTLTQENKDFLREIIQHYEGFAAITSDDAENRAIRAEGYLRVGTMRSQLGELKDAEKNYDEALGLYRQLAADFPDRPEFRKDLANCLNNLGMLYSTIGRLNEAEAACSSVVDMQKQLVADYPAEPAYRRSLANYCNNLGHLLSSTGKLDQAATANANALDIRKQLAADFPDIPVYRAELASSLNNRGLVFKNTGRQKEAEADFAEALAIRKQLAVTYHHRPDVRKNLAQAYDNLGTLFLDMDRNQESEAAYGEALKLMKQLAAEYPASVEYRETLARCHHNLSVPLKAMGRIQDAETACAVALMLQKQLAADYPNRPEYRRAVAMSYVNQGRFFGDRRQFKEAEAAYLDAVAIMKQLAKEFPSQTSFQASVTSTLLSLAILSNDREEYRKTLAYADEALPYHDAALKGNSRHPTYRQFYRNNWLVRMPAHYYLRDQASVLSAAAKMRDVGFDPPEDAYRAGRALAQCILMVNNDKQLTEAERPKAVQFYGDEALKLLKDAVAKGYTNVEQMKKEPDLDPVRERADFKKLIAELEARPVGGASN